MDKIEDRLYTVFGEKLLEQMDQQPELIPLSEYPRPQMVRDSYLCLNGWWEYAVLRCRDEVFSSEAEGSLTETAMSWGRILVPFSPEAPLSTADRQVMPEDHLFYRKKFLLPADFNRGRVLLHFDAVDYACKVTVNGHAAGEHKGGYFAFTFDITDFLEEENLLELDVTDPTDTSYIARGKQKTRRGTIWYTPQSGIWQTVWLESVPREYIESLRITPDIDRREVRVEIESVLREGKVRITDGRTVTAQGRIENGTAVVSFPDFELWSPENPKLYDLEIAVGSDTVRSYLGMRKFSSGRDKDGIPRLFLNNKPYYHNGVLDQGYYPDGLLTPPSDAAMLSDISMMKDLGFNMLRKHIKIEPLRWYYHCDRLGMIVWQDMVNGGRDRVNLLNVLAFLKVPCRDDRYLLFGRHEKAGREEYYADAQRTIRHLYNVTSIGMWVPFNEAWGQFDGDKVGEWVKTLDSSRTIDRYSGWLDQGHSDFTSLHIYFRPFKVPKSKGKCLILSEFGGYSCKEPDHFFITKRDFGYKKFKEKKELNRGYRELFEKEIIPAISAGLSASVYTQLTDVEDEVNGILTYDRKVLKITAASDVNRMIGNACRF